jgi:hypothetical protein
MLGIVEAAACHVGVVVVVAVKFVQGPFPMRWDVWRRRWAMVVGRAR